MALDFTQLAKRIKEKKCVLLLGPEVGFGEGSITLREDISRYFNGSKLEYDIDNFLIFRNITQKYSYIEKLTDYYQEKLEPSKLHYLITKIPFHLIISLSPDSLLKDAYSRSGIPLEFHYYHRDVNPKEINLEEGKTILYNLFGHIDDDESLIVTSKDMIEFIKAIVKKPLPKTIVQELASAKAFLFVGFNFESWYLKLLLNLIKQQEKGVPYAITPPPGIDHKLESFYLDNFNVEFISGTAQETIQELYNACKAQSMAREVNANNSGPIERLIEDLTSFISEARLEDTFNLLKRHMTLLKSSSNGQEIELFCIQTSMRYNEYIKKKMLGLSPPQSELNEITQALLYIIDLIKKTFLLDHE